MPFDRLTRAWKDPEYRETLSADDLAALPEHPSGWMELTDDDLATVSGGAGTVTSSGLFCSFSAECMPGICNFNTWICPHAVNQVNAVVLLGGVRAIDADGRITPQEQSAIYQQLAQWQTNPRLTPEQVNDISRVAADLRPYLDDADREIVDRTLDGLHHNGTLTEGQLADVRTFAAAAVGGQ